MFSGRTTIPATPRIFALRRSGTLIRPRLGILYTGIVLPDAVNWDWEDIASDNHGFLYIGDIGNNSNDRKEFAVYKIPEPSPTGESSADKIELIQFHYPKDKNPSEKRKDVNAEALFWAHDRLFILTKNDDGSSAALYTLETKNIAGENAMAFRGSFAFYAPVTGADASPDGKRLAVLTYRSVWLFETAGRSNDYFHGSIKWLPIFAGQCEGIALDGERIIISNEEGKLFQIPFNRLVSLKSPR
jgi:hypothetical protein